MDSEKPTEVKTYSCSNCSKEFQTLILFNRHKKTHNLSCEKCNQVFKTFSKLRQHNKAKHPKLKFYKCKVCPDVTFTLEKEFLLHLRNDHEGKIIESHMCNVCGKTFRTSSELTLHIRSKCGTEKQFICKECGQKLMSPGSLYTHLKRHKGENSFMCRFCAKLFLTSGQLKVHERIHTQQKVFICDVCGKGFCHRQSLITHISVHTGIKPYQCEGCGKSFSCVGNLLKHRRTHSDSCGAIPMTSHRVQNPSTKIKVRINTPASSKLKRMQMKQELEAKFASLEKEKKEEIKSTDVKSENEQHSVEETLKMESQENKNTKEEDEEDSDYTDGNTSDSGPELSEKDEENSNNYEEERPTNKRKRRTISVQEEEFEDFMKIRKLSKGKTATCKYCQKEYSNFKWLFKHEQEHAESDNDILDQTCIDPKEQKEEERAGDSWTCYLQNGLQENEKFDLFKRHSVSELIKQTSMSLVTNNGILQRQICCGLSALNTFINKIKDKEMKSVDITDLLDSAKIFADLYFVVSNSQNTQKNEFL